MAANDYDFAVKVSWWVKPLLYFSFITLPIAKRLKRGERYSAFMSRIAFLGVSVEEKDSPSRSR